MSNSFKDAVRQVMEGAKEKTLDGMTPDAKHFRHDLHPVKDPGVKLMVQKDSETKDYEKMFKPDMSKAKERLADMSSDKALDKYVEYNEAVKIEEKKHMKGCTCESCMNKEDKEEEKEAAKSDKKIAEASVMLGRQGMTPKAPVSAPPQGAGPSSVAPAPKPKATPFTKGGPAVAPKPKAPAVMSQPNIRPTGPSQAPAGAPDKASSGGPVKPATPRTSEVVASKAAGTPDSRNLRVPVKAASGEGATGKALAGLGVSKADRLNPNFLKSQGITAKPGSAEANLALKAKMGAEKAKVTAAENPKSAANKPTPPRPGAGAGPSRKPAGPAPVKTNLPAIAPNAPKNPALQVASYEIEINGQSYMVSEAHAAAIAAYVEKYGITEKSDPAVGEFISKEMKHPEKLTAQGKKQKIKQAIAIYYSKKRHGEKP